MSISSISGKSAIRFAKLTMTFSSCIRSTGFLPLNRRSWRYFRLAHEAGGKGLIQRGQADGEVLEDFGSHPAHAEKDDRAEVVVFLGPEDQLIVHCSTIFCTLTPIIFAWGSSSDVVHHLRVLLLDLLFGPIARATPPTSLCEEYPARRSSGPQENRCPSPCSRPLPRYAPRGPSVQGILYEVRNLFDSSSVRVVRPSLQMAPDERLEAVLRRRLIYRQLGRRLVKQLEVPPGICTCIDRFLPLLREYGRWECCCGGIFPGLWPRPFRP